MIDADRPILNSSQDRLNRTVFAKYLARCILDHSDQNSMVLGLYGNWGSGKTSIINLMVEELNFAATNIDDNAKPILLNFSPWSYSGQNQLIYNFFRRLSSSLRKVTYLQEANHIIHLLELYVSFFTNKPVPKPLRETRTVKEKITFSPKEDVYGWESGRDLTEVKAELNALLSGQWHKIIIIIDNISRLYDDEIKQIFQIVKSIGDFSNTVYLLSFDKDQVVHALNRVNGEGGQEFVEKVVQLPFEIPEIDPQSLEALLIDRLQEILKLVPKDVWQKDYWSLIYYSAFRYFFKNVRDITRYLNTLYFSYIRVRDIVHPCDFFALTALEVFIPPIYAAIRDNKDLFTDLIDHVYLENKDFIEKDRIRFEAILTLNTRIDKSILKELLMIIFPRLRKLYGAASEYLQENVSRTLKRVCDPDSFDTYFRLSIQKAHLPDVEFKTLINLAAKAEIFDQTLARLNKDDRILSFLSQLDSNILDKIPLEHIENIIISFFDNADLFPKGASDQLSLDTYSHLHRITRRLANRLTEEKRYQIFQVAIEKMTNSLMFAIFEIRELLKEHQEGSDTVLPEEYRLLTMSHLDSLKKLVCEKIVSWAKLGRLLEHPNRLDILYAWVEWGDEKQAKEYVLSVVQTDPGLMLFLQAILAKPIHDARTEYKKKDDWEQYLNQITDFVSIDAIKDRAKAIFIDGYFDKLREEEQLAIVIFLDLIQADITKFVPKTTA